MQWCALWIDIGSDDGVSSCDITLELKQGCNAVAKMTASFITRVPFYSKILTQFTKLVNCEFMVKSVVTSLSSSSMVVTDWTHWFILDGSSVMNELAMVLVIKKTTYGGLIIFEHTVVSFVPSDS